MKGIKNNILSIGVAAALLPALCGAETKSIEIPDGARQDASVQQDPNADNYCIGGFSRWNRVIPGDGVIRNRFKQTTAQDCQADGGTPVFMPDLKPSITDGKLA